MTQDNTTGFAIAIGFGALAVAWLLWPKPDTFVDDVHEAEDFLELKYPQDYACPYCDLTPGTEQGVVTGTCASLN